MTTRVWFAQWIGVWYHIGQAIYINDRAYDERLRKLYEI